MVVATGAAVAAAAGLLVLLPTLASAQQPQTTGSASYPATGKVEGCFNEFASLMQVGLKFDYHTGGPGLIAVPSHACACTA